jgi:hypothetical protein
MIRIQRLKEIGSAAYRTAQLILRVEQDVSDQKRIPAKVSHGFLKLRYIPLLFLILQTAGCKDFKKGTFLSDRIEYVESKEAFIAQCMSIVPCENIGYGVSSKNTPLGKLDALVLTFRQAELSLLNDSLLEEKAKSLSNLVRKSITSSPSFSGFALEFQQLKQPNDSVIKNSSVKYKFNFKQ